MTNSIQPPASTSAPLQALSCALIKAENALRGVARRIGAWLKVRARAATDRDALAGMSDRELHDIGLDRGSLSAVADGAWRRD